MFEDPWSNLQHLVDLEATSSEVCIRASTCQKSLKNKQLLKKKLNGLKMVEGVSTRSIHKRV